MRQKVLSSRKYQGFTIEHIEDQVHKSNVPFHGTGYFKHRFWWVVELEDDAPTLREAKELIDSGRSRARER